MTVEGYFERALNSEWCDQALDDHYVREHISYDDLVFFFKCSKFDGDARNGIRIWEIVFIFMITGFQWGTANSHNP